MPDRFVLVDGSSYFYRAFHAIPRLTTSRGLPTNAAKGFTTMLKRVLRRFQPPFAAVVFDAARKTFRSEVYPAYKSHRPPMPDDLSRQIPYIKEIPRAYGIPTLELDGFEADDIIATLARRGVDRGLEVLVVTADKDLMQMVTKKAGDETAPGVVIYDDGRDRRVGIDEVVERFGVGPERVVDVLALVGDATDNIPGVRGIGEKTAAALISKHGSLEEILAHPENIDREKLRETLVREADSARLSRRLAQLVFDLPIEMDLEKYRPGVEDRARLAALFRELEFTSELRELEGAGGAEKRRALDAAKYRQVQDLAELEAVVREASEMAAIEVLGDLAGLSICTGPGRAWYVPVAAQAALGVGRPFSRSEAVGCLRPLFENKNIVKAFHNVKRNFRWFGPDVGPFGDAMLASYLLNPDQLAFGLERIAAEALGHDLTPIGGKKGEVDPLPPDQAAHVACERADALRRVTPVLEQRLVEAGMERIYREIELPLARVLADIESAGVKIDVELLRRLSVEFDGRMKALERKAFEQAGVEFNVNSTKQLAEVLFGKLQLPVLRRTETGYSTDSEVLEALSSKHPLPATILAHRSLAKLKGTYVDALPALMDPKTGRLHTSYNQTGAATGRLSSSDPNLQNIPIRTDEGRLIRRAFIAEAGWTLVVADYSQIELRLLAHFSEDPALMTAFREGRDIHRQTASEVFEVMPEMVSDDMRRKAKEVNFGIIYGMSAHGLSQRLGIPMPDAKKYIERYFARYPGVRKFIDSLLARGRERGYVETAYGRRRYVPGLDSKNGAARSAAERAATNAPLQGTAADVIKIAMIRLHANLGRARMILQVHDELVVESPQEDAAKTAELLKEEMEHAAEFRVPLRVDVASGPNWAQAKK